MQQVLLQEEKRELQEVDSTEGVRRGSMLDSLFKNLLKVEDAIVLLEDEATPSRLYFRALGRLFEEYSWDDFYPYSKLHGDIGYGALQKALKDDRARSDEGARIILPVLAGVGRSNGAYHFTKPVESYVRMGEYSTALLAEIYNEVKEDEHRKFLFLAQLAGRASRLGKRTKREKKQGKELWNFIEPILKELSEITVFDQFRRKRVSTTVRFYEDIVARTAPGTPDWLMEKALRTSRSWKGRAESACAKKQIYKKWGKNLLGARNKAIDQGLARNPLLSREDQWRIFVRRARAKNPKVLEWVGKHLGHISDIQSFFQHVEMYPAVMGSLKNKKVKRGGKARDVAEVLGDVVEQRGIGAIESLGSINASTMAKLWPTWDEKMKVRVIEKCNKSVASAAAKIFMKTERPITDGPILRAIMNHSRAEVRSQLLWRAPDIARMSPQELDLYRTTIKEWAEKDRSSRVRRAYHFRRF